MEERLIRTEMLLGAAAMGRLARAHVAVFGLGGVGSWCAEALARCGVGALTLIDEDTVAESNLNRQIEALGSTIGQSKAEAMARRVLDIAPGCRVTARAERYEARAARRVLPRAVGLYRRLHRPWWPANWISSKPRGRGAYPSSPPSGRGTSSTFRVCA